MKQLIVVLGVVRNDAGQILFIRQDRPGTAWNGRWGLPGGKIEIGEDPSAAVAREIKEETNLVVEVGELLPKIFWHDYSEIGLHIIYAVYKCKIISGDLIPEKDKVLEIKFLSKAEIDHSKLMSVDDQILEFIK